MQRSTILGILAVLAAVLLSWYALTRPVSPAPVQEEGPEISSYTEDEEYYTIEAHWPARTSLPGDGDPAAVLLMKNWVQDTILEFKKNGNYAALTPEDIEMQGFAEGRLHALDISYFTSASPRTVSYVFSVYLDTGGAHPNGYYQTFVFDTETGAYLSLADAFAAGSSYLETLSRVSREKLPGVIGEFADTEYIASGTTPEEANFETFYFDGDDLVLLFSPYQVGPWALGPVVLPIPSSELTGLKTEYP